MARRIPITTRACQIAATAALCLWCAPAAVGQEAFWDRAPYRIQAVLALDVPGGAAEELGRMLPLYLQDRAEAAVAPAWELSAQMATGPLRYQVLKSVSSQVGDPPASLFPAEGDKLLLLAVRQTADGYQITGREFDRFAQRWGTPIVRDCRQQDALPELLFLLAWEVVAPVARLEIDPDDPKRIVLTPKGMGFTHRGGAAAVKPGDIFQPLLRRTTRGGELAAEGIQAIPWTYVEVSKVENGTAIGQLFSGSARPFGIRRRGRVDQVAIALRGDAGQTTVNLRSRTKADKPLAGYNVFARDTDVEATRPIGATDRAGRINVGPGRTRLQLLFFKNGKELLARLPIVPGAELELTVPLPDDDARLQAEARLSALREELIDVVVRRNILMARTRQKIEAKDWPKAQELLRSLDQLPGRAQFNLAISKEARLLRSDDPQIQRRIDRLVEATEVALNQFLDNRPISDLQDELRAAQRGGAEAGKESDS